METIKVAIFGTSRTILLLLWLFLNAILWIVIFAGFINSCFILAWLFSLIVPLSENEQLRIIERASHANFVEYGKLPDSVSELNEKFDLKLPSHSRSGGEFVIDKASHEVYIRGYETGKRFKIGGGEK